jgi:hypothetical protein
MESSVISFQLMFSELFGSCGCRQIVEGGESPDTAIVGSGHNAMGDGSFGRNL